MKLVRVAKDRWNFELDGTNTSITPFGGNVLDTTHPCQGTLFGNFNADDCDRRLGLMSELGLNCLRQPIGVNCVYDQKTGFKAQGLRSWETFISLAEKHGIYLMPVGGYIGGNDWFDVERLADSGRQLDWDCAFWEAFCSHFRGHPAIWAWDLRNELLYWDAPHGMPPEGPSAIRIQRMLKDQWPAWLEAKYGTVDTMNRICGKSYKTFDDVPASVRFEDRPFDLLAFDFRNYLNDRGYEWCKRQCQVIRSTDPDHMICQGNNAWLSPDQDLFLANGFHNRALHDLFDFVTFHPYPAWQCVPNGRGDPLDGGEALDYWLSACIANARMDFYGKPVVVQEFGWYGGGTSRFLCDLPFRTEEEHANYARILMETLMPHVNGFLNWPTFDMPDANDISNHGGIFTADGKRKALAAVFGDIAQRARARRQTRAQATTTLTFSLLGLYTSRAYQDNMWDAVHECIKSAQIPDFRFV